jgi:hypothetical protein
MMNNDHLLHVNDVLKFVELFSGKKLDNREKSLLVEALRNNYGAGYQRAAHHAADIVYYEKFKLATEHFEWFMRTHRIHLKAWGTDNQKKYSLPNVRDVIYDKDEDCLKVYYDDEWWHYDRRGTWY